MRLFICRQFQLTLIGGTCSCNSVFALNGKACKDTTLPSITCPADKTVLLPYGSSSYPVTYSTTSSDNVGSPTVSCTHISGTSFTANSTLVNCTATDATGNKGSCTFNVNLQSVTGPYYLPALCVNAYDVAHTADFETALIANLSA